MLPCCFAAATAKFVDDIGCAPCGHIVKHSTVWQIVVSYHSMLANVVVFKATGACVAAMIWCQVAEDSRGKLNMLHVKRMPSSWKMGVWGVYHAWVDTR